MVSRIPVPFYDEDKGEFLTNDPELKLSPHLGEDVDNPIVSFRNIENIFDDRINQLSSKLFDLKKIQSTQKSEMENQRRMKEGNPYTILARKNLNSYFDRGTLLTIDDVKDEELLNDKKGVFVSLKINLSLFHLLCI